MGLVLELWDLRLSDGMSLTTPHTSAKYTKLQSKANPDCETALHKAQNEEDKTKREAVGDVEFRSHLLNRNGFH